MKKKDSLTKKQRSFCMSQVKSKDTKVECLIRSALFKRGYRFRKHVKTLPGRPDIVFVKERLVIQIDGDFWHGRRSSEWLYNMRPFWIKKIESNILRDKSNKKKLRNLGWSTLRIWESDFYKNPEKILSLIEDKIVSNRI